jgi:hypothetical protein
LNFLYKTYRVRNFSELIFHIIGPEYGTTQGAWRGVLEESDKLADLHTEVADKLVNNVTVSIKQWQKENYHKSMMHFKETKELDDQFKKVCNFNYVINNFCHVKRSIKLIV